TALGAGASTLSVSAGTILNNTTGTALTLTNNNAITIGGDFTFTGSNSLNLGMGAVTLSAPSVATISGSNFTLGGSVGPAGTLLTKAGAGTLVLLGGSCSSPVTVNAGILGGGFSTSGTVTL